MTMKKLLTFSLLILFSINCHHARVRLEGEAGAKKGQVKTFEYHYWLGEIYPRKIEFDGTKICPSGIYEIDEFYTFKDSALTQATLGIYIPRTLQITCN